MIGTLAIQVASARGWRVAASASEPNHDYLVSLGAAVAVDYRDPSWPEQIRAWTPGGVEAAIAVQPRTAAASLSMVRSGGTLITISPGRLAAERGVHVEMVLHQMDVRNELALLMTQLAAGELPVEVERVYPFENALDALAKVQTRHARGKIVLRLD